MTGHRNQALDVANRVLAATVAEGWAALSVEVGAREPRVIAEGRWQIEVSVFLGLDPRWRSSGRRRR